MPATLSAYHPTEESSTISVNSRLVIFEERAFNAMRCNTADDVIRIMLLEELQPAFSSAMNIGCDEHGIWSGSVLADIWDRFTSNDGDTSSSKEKGADKSNENRVDKSKELNSTSTSISSSAPPDSTMSSLTTTVRNNANTRAASPSAPDNGAPQADEDVTLSEDGDGGDVDPEFSNLQEPSFLLPIQMQIHPFYGNHTPSGIFR